MPYNMKRKLIPLLLCLLIAVPFYAQEKKNNLNNVVNTLKERLTVEGYAQMAYTYDDTEGARANTFEVKRAILMLRGKITDRWSCYFSYNFANTSRILEVYTEYKFLPELSVRLGEFKTMFTFENPMSPCSVELINVYSQATNYLAGYDSSDPLYGGNAGRDIGLMIYGDLFGKLFNYKLAVMNGQGINKKDGNNQKDIVGTLIANPTPWLAIGGTFVKGKGHAVGTSAVNPDIKVATSYVGSFTDTAKAKENALLLYNSGLSVIFAAAGQSGLGVIDAAVEQGKFVIGVDSDQAAALKDSQPDMANVIITSAIKNISDNAVKAVDRAMKDEIPYGTREVFGIAEGAVGIAENEFYEKLLSEEDRAKVEELKQQVIAGEVEMTPTAGITTEKINEIRDAVRP